MIFGSFYGVVVMILVEMTKRRDKARHNRGRLEANEAQIEKACETRIKS